MRGSRKPGRRSFHAPHQKETTMRDSAAKTFTIFSPGDARRGITAKDNAVSVGEAGRGRELVKLPVPPGAVSVNDLVMTVPGDGIVVLIKDHSGFRGGWLARNARTPEDWVRVLKLREDHWAAIAAARAAFKAAYGSETDGVSPSGETVYFSSSPQAQACQHAVHGTPGPSCPGCDPCWPDATGAPEWKVLAKGFCAQGDAGRMGGGPEYLVRCQVGTAFEIVRNGRLYDKPAVLRVDVTEDGVVVSDPEAAARTAIATQAAWG